MANTSYKAEMTNNLSGFPSSLNIQQTRALAVLKESLRRSIFHEKAKSHPDGDEFLLRVLRATMKNKNTTAEFMPKRAHDRVEAILGFKEKHKVTEVPENFQHFRKVYPRFVYKDRMAKKVLLINRSGEFITKGKFSHFSENEWSQSIGFEMEAVEKAMREISASEGVENRGCYIISDFKGLGLSALANKKATIALANISGENYPEVIEKVYLVNAPWIFGKIFNLIKPFLDPQTVSKLRIFSGFPEELREQLDLDLLPSEYGGKNECFVPHPMDHPSFKEELITYNVDIH